MKLPHRNKVVIPPDKLNQYLLSLTHPQGKFKAQLLRKWGFNETNAHLLEEELRNVAASQDVAESRPSHGSRGTNFVVNGTIKTPKGGNRHIKTVWFVAQNKTPPSLVTITFK